MTETANLKHDLGTECFEDSHFGFVSYFAFRISDFPEGSRP